MNLTPIQREKQLFRLWQSLPAPGTSFRAARAERVVVIAHGTPNDGPGPDFLDAVLVIDGSLRVGHVEMHLRESDWFGHGHQDDPAYHEVILHVLAEDVPDSGQALSIVTVSAGRLEAIAEAAEASDVARDGLVDSASGRAADVLTDFAWGRLMRRVTEILRDGNGGTKDGKIERAFLLRLFDALGYSRNREPMKAVARRILELRHRFADADFDRTAQMIFAAAGIPAERLATVGRTFMPEGRLEAVLPGADPGSSAPRWDYRGRPVNAPERRLWGGAKLAFDLFRRDLLQDQLKKMARCDRFDSLLQPFIVRLGTETILGRSRAAEIVVNVLCPVALAAGVLRREIDLIQGACLTYRNAPALAPNGIVREVERRLPDCEADGAFVQQGAIEYYQRVLSPDRRSYSMVAESKCQVPRRKDKAEG